LQLKKLELEFAVDPLFKKASADFDEGGAKGLLLNHLSIDSEGRIVFDSSDETAEAKSYPNNTQMQQTLVDPTVPPAEELSNLSLLPEGQPRDQEINLLSLASKFFPDLSILDSQDICPSMKSFTLGDPSSELNIPFLKASEDWRESQKRNDSDRPLIDIPIGDKSGIFLDSENAAGFDDDDDDGGGALGGFDIGPDVGFGEGGEAWAKDAALEPMLRVARANDDELSTGREGRDGIEIGDFDPANPHADAYTVGLNHQRRMRDNDPTENILSYFDAALKSTKAAAWAGPEHWRIRKINAAQASSDNPPAPRVRKEKEPFEIDFLGPMDQSIADMLYTPAATNAAISLPKAQWKTKGRNLLPDDRHFNSRSLLQLWLKPKARVRRRKVVPGMPNRGVSGSGQGEDGQQGEMGGHPEMDEAYWAKRREEEEEAHRRQEDEEGQERKGDYDANFFADDDGALPYGGGLPDDIDDDDDDGPVGFTDAREMLSPPPTATTTSDSQPPGFGDILSSHQPADSQPSNLLPGSFGSQLVTQGGRRLRPEYVNYARTAKKVDVRRLKENMWRGMSAELMSSFSPPPSSSDHDMTTNNGPPTPAPTDPGLDTDADGDVDMDMDINMATDPTAIKSKTRAAPPTLKFTHLIRNLQNVYPEQQMRDISTSYCFICLLHLANEKGLVLEGDYVADMMMGMEGKEEGRKGLMREITVSRDESLGAGYVGE
jgi:condensin complex subunit 2